jgi:tetratricopeptide (TPR) repeat protein
LKAMRDFTVTLFCLVLLFVFALNIENYMFNSIPEEIRDIPFYLKIIGEGKSVLSDLSINQADLYYHGGVMHSDDECTGIFGLQDGSEDDLHGAEEYDDRKERLNKMNILFRISNAMEIEEHTHLEKKDIREIIPWLYYAIKVDPENIQAYTLTAYWLSDRLKDPDEAIKLLNEGLEANPGVWQIYAEIGRIEFKRNNYKKAIYALEQAKRQLIDSEYDRLELRQVFSYLANAYSRTGKNAEAKLLYRQIQTLFPEDKHIKNIIQKL